MVRESICLNWADFFEDFGFWVLCNLWYFVFDYWIWGCYTQFYLFEFVGGV